MFELLEAGDEVLVDRLGELERLTSAVAAEQARVTAELHARRGLAGGGGGGAHEGALARHESPYAGREHVALALGLGPDLPGTPAALERGEPNRRRGGGVAPP